MTNPGRNTHALVFVSGIILLVFLSACSATKKDCNYRGLRIAQAQEHNNDTMEGALPEPDFRPYYQTRIKIGDTKLKAIHFHSSTLKNTSGKRSPHPALPAMALQDSADSINAHYDHRLAVQGFNFSVAGLVLLLLLIPFQFIIGFFLMSILGILGLIDTATVIGRIDKTKDPIGWKYAQAGLVISIVECSFLMLVLGLVFAIIVDPDAFDLLIF